jgi:enoyl-CoA hydratase/carnithine racemase
MSEHHILVTREAGIMEIRFNRPEKKNAITNAMYGAVADALESAAEDKAIRCVLFSAAGDFFTAGNDLMDFAAVNAGAEAGAMPRQVGRFLERMIMFEKPVVAAVQGNAVGVGVTMLLQCDLVYIADAATLSTPFVALGLVPENASSITMPARMGHVRAFQMLGLGELLNGRDAAACGLANAALPAGEVLDKARAAATALTKKPAEALRLAKGLMRNREALMTRMREEGEIFGQRLKSAEAAEAFAAFMQRRPPNFEKLG